MLLINTAWDFLSAIVIWCAFCTQDVMLLEQQQQQQTRRSRGVPLLQVEEMGHHSSSSSSSPGSAEPNSGAEVAMSIVQKIAEMHTAMWNRHVDSHNHAACMLMAWWVLTLGCMRLLAAVMWGEWLILGMVSYGIEAVAFMGEGLKSTMAPKKACPASLFSLACLLICMTTYF
jgi:hypothetical protein